MKPNEIKAALLLKNIRQSEIAKKLGVTQAAICMTVSGVRKNPPLRRAIAEALGKTEAEIWPEIA